MKHLTINTITFTLILLLLNACYIKPPSLITDFSDPIFVIDTTSMTFDKNYKLEFTKEVINKQTNNLMRLIDLKTNNVLELSNCSNSTLKPGPKYFWSSDRQFIVADCWVEGNGKTTKTIKFIRLKGFESAEEITGQLIDYDPAAKVLVYFEKNPNPELYPFVRKKDFIKQIDIRIDSMSIPSRGNYPRVSLNKVKKEIWIDYFDKLTYEEVLKREFY